MKSRPGISVPLVINWKALLCLLLPLTGHAADLTTSLPADFLPEGVGWDGAHSRFLLSSIRKHSIVAVDPRNGHATDFGKAPGSVLGLHLDATGQTVWAVWTKFGHAFKDNHGTGLSAWSTKDAKHLGDWPLPDTDPRANLGDLMLLNSDTVIVSDSGTGAISRFDARTHEFKTIVPPGKLKSPQGMVSGDKTGTILVADYPTGLWHISLSDGKATLLAASANAELRGIDGLYRWGKQIIAIQNGTKTPRILAITLGENDAIVEVQRLLEMTAGHEEPSLGTLANSTFWFVVNGQWSQYDDDLNPKDDSKLEAPRLQALELSSPASSTTR